MIGDDQLFVLTPQLRTQKMQKQATRGSVTRHPSRRWAPLTTGILTKTMTELFENYTQLWVNDELNLLERAAKFFSELAPQNERWIEQGQADRDAWTKAGSADFMCRNASAVWRRGRRPSA